MGLTGLVRNAMAEPKRVKMEVVTLRVPRLTCTCGEWLDIASEDVLRRAEAGVESPPFGCPSCGQIVIGVPRGAHNVKLRGG